MNIRMFKLSIGTAQEMNVVADKVVDAMNYFIADLDAKGATLPNSSVKYVKADITNVEMSQHFAPGVSDAVVADYIANNP